ncbi:polysaccharide deacetylase family protein [Aliikangiella sp. G2MR2-5]|uniref:polysaccharide deacetylase family protein n=1 Tax=Aliikangiella sp. G2MR2-5 TaxID=2788943 RepID=UPI0018A8D66B|nr:polysaccharide deacetylase family protein [Aliikangiella sp. G2MR2-5]
MRKKALLAKVLSFCLPGKLFPLVSSAGKDCLTVLAYHRVVDDRQKDYLFDYELVSASTDEFEKQVKYVKRHFNPISMEQLVASLEQGESLPERPLLITFDDGFDDNYYNAFPILKKHQVPATIFISTGYLGTKDIIWFDKFVRIINAACGERWQIKKFSREYEIPVDEMSRRKVAALLLREMKRLSNPEREAVMLQLSEKYESKISDRLKSQMMTWEQVVEMNEDVISFGSHTVSHPILARLNSQALRFELGQSKKDIEDKLTTEASSISYPDGNEDAYNKEVLAETEKAGYKVGFSYLSGVNKLPIVDRFALRRLHVEYYVDFSQFKALLCLPRIFSEH